jgi:predicted N-formylglutamate amidohydrolase
LITCDHASNDLKYLTLKDYEEELVRSQEYFDIGAADFTHALSERIKCLAVLSNFTKVYIDPAKPLVDSQLIRTYYQWIKRSEGDQIGDDSLDDDRLPVSLNCQGYRFYERLNTCYLEYHKLLREALEFIEPDFILNIHSHDPDLSGASNLKDVILYTPPSNTGRNLT